MPDNNVARLPIPHVHRTVREVLGTAMSLEAAGDLKNLVLLSQDDDGSVTLLSCQGGTVEGYAGLNWLLDLGKQILMKGEPPDRS